MPSPSGTAYNSFREKLATGVISLGTGVHSFKLALLTAYTPNVDSHALWADVSAKEVSGAGYTGGGVALTGATLSRDDTADQLKFDADDAAWTGLDVGTPSHAVLRDISATGEPLIGYWPVTTPTNGGNYTIQFDTLGVLRFS